jgi:glucose/mannose transport system substrate-binding protein
MKVNVPKALGFLLGIAAISALTLHAQPLPVEALHGWTSSSERLATQQLAQNLRNNGVDWKSSPISGNRGAAALKVLNSRLLSDNRPDITVLQGDTLQTWARLGLVQPLNAVAQREHWQTILWPLALSSVTHQTDIVGVPLSIHRSNLLLYNKRLFLKMGLVAPTTWPEFEALVRQLKKHNLRTLGWSDEGWQIGSVFEALLLSEVGPDLYQELIVAPNLRAWSDPRIATALLRLRWLRSLGLGKLPEKTASELAKTLFNSEVAMLITGDWATADLIAWGAIPDKDFACIAVPGTENIHLYSIESLVMLKTPRQRTQAQEKVAEVALNLPTQIAFNQSKSAIPVRADLDAQAIAKLDPCARDAWNVFATPSSPKVPSLINRMISTEPTKNALNKILLDFVTTPNMDPVDAQNHLSVVMRASTKTH